MKPSRKVNDDVRSMDLVCSFRSKEVEVKDLGEYSISLREDGSLVVYHAITDFQCVIRQTTKL